MDAVCGYLLERRGDRVGATLSFEQASQAYFKLGFEKDADRFGLELDRLRGDASSAALRVECLRAAGLQSWAEVGERSFPHLSSTPSLAKVRATSLEKLLSDEIPQLEVLGGLRLSRAGQALPPPQEQGRRLLLALLEAWVLGREGVRVLELLETLYPDQDEQKAENALKQLVYRLRGVLGKGAVLRLRDAYALGTRVALDSDAERFLEGINTQFVGSEVRPHLSLYSDAERFLEGTNTRLWRGVAFEDFDVDQGAALRNLLHKRLNAVLKATLERDPAEGHRVLELLLVALPFNPDLLERAEGLRGQSVQLERMVLQARAEL